MEIPVSLFINNKTLLGILNVPDHQRYKPVVAIMCYGFNGNRVEQHRMSVTMGRFFEKNGINFCRFDFRNQGLSDGSFDDFTFSEKQEDLNEIIKFIKACFRRDDILCYLVGFSNGCKVAIDVLNDNPNVDGLILWNPVLQELSDNKNGHFGDSRRLYRHPITGRPYKKFYSLRLNTKLLYELNNDKSMTKLQKTDKNVLCVLSNDDMSIKTFISNTDVFNKKSNIQMIYINNTDHLFGSVKKVKEVIKITLDWILDQLS